MDRAANVYARLCREQAQKWAERIARAKDLQRADPAMRNPADAAGRLLGKAG